MDNIIQKERFDTYFESTVLIISGLMLSFNIVSKPHFALTLLLFSGIILFLHYFYLLGCTLRISRIIVFVLLVASYIFLCTLTKTWYLPFLSYLIGNTLRKENNIHSPFLFSSFLSILTYQCLWLLQIYSFSIKQHIVHLAIYLCFGILIYAIEFFILNILKRTEKMHNTLIELALHSLNEQNLITELSQSKHLIEEKARLEERERISSTIHNHAGHTITTSIVALDAADLLLDIDKEKAREKYQIAHKRMQESLNSIRVAIRLLTKENEPTSLSDFVYTASQSIDEFVTTTAIKVRHNLNEEQLKQEDCLLPPTYIEYLNGVILESFSNGIRHGSATTFIVLLEKSDTMLSLTIEDNGTGMNQYTREEIHDKLTHGYGLKRVDSFARKYGGNTIYSYKEGFSVKISLPLTPLTISPKTYTLQEDNYDAD